MKNKTSLSARLCWAALLLSPALFTACAPTTTSASSAQNSLTNTLAIAPGQSASVSVRASLDALNVDDTQEKTLDIDFNNRDALNRVQGKEQPVSWFSVTGVKAMSDDTSATSTASPAWNAHLEAAFLGYEIVKTQEDGSGHVDSVRYRNYIRTVLNVSAPAGATPGLTLLDVSIHNANGKDGHVMVYADVKK